MIDRQELWGFTPYVAILIAAVLPTHVWRWLGVLFAGRLDEQSEFFIWVKAVATSLVAALIAKLILFPTGPLETVPTVARVGATAIAFTVFLAAGKRLAVGILAAELLLIGAWFSLR